MIDPIKSLPSRAGSLLSTAKDMLQNAPTNYSGPQALHLPKKVELIKESISKLSEIPARSKELLQEGLALIRCVTGLTRGGDASQCDNIGEGGVSIAGTPRKGSSLGRKVLMGFDSSSTPGSPQKTSPSTVMKSRGGARQRESSNWIISSTIPCSMVLLTDSLAAMAGIQQFSSTALSGKGKLHFQSSIPDMKLQLKIGRRKIRMPLPATIETPSFTLVKFMAAAPRFLPVLGQVISLPGHTRRVTIQSQLAGTRLAISYKSGTAHPVYINEKHSGNTPFETCLTPERNYSIRIGAALGPFSIEAKPGKKIVMNEATLLERAIASPSQSAKASAKWATAQKNQQKEFPETAKSEPLRQQTGSEDTAKISPAETTSDSSSTIRPRRFNRKLSREQIRSSMKPIGDLVRGCYNRFKSPGLYKARITVNGWDGSVHSVKVIGHLGTTPTAKCIKAAVFRSRFPIFDGIPLSFIFPFSLK